MTDSIIINAMTDILNSPLGDDAVYTPAGGSAKNIRVIFRKEYVSELGVAGYTIYAQVLTSDVAGAMAGDTLLINGVNYKIKEPPHEGNGGMSELVLSID